MDKELNKYRELIIATEQKAQESYDKTVISLSGGALGISFAFIDKVIKTGEIVSINLLFWAWLLWGLSITSILTSYFFSNLSLRKTIRQIDNDEIYTSHVGGIADYITATTNILGGLLFLIAVILMAIFVKINI